MAAPPRFLGCVLCDHNGKGYEPGAFIVLVERSIGSHVWKEWTLICAKCRKRPLLARRPAHKLTLVRKKAK